LLHTARHTQTQTVRAVLFNFIHLHFSTVCDLRDYIQKYYQTIFWQPARLTPSYSS